MKLITAIVKPFKLGEIRKALAGIGIQGLTVIDVKGIGRQQGHIELYRGVEHKVNYLPKAQLSIAVADESVDKVVAAIMRHAKSGSSGMTGDGKIFISGLESALRVRTGEKDAEAI